MRNILNIRSQAITILCLLPWLSGCLRSTRSVMQTHPPSQILSSSLEVLARDTAKRFDAIESLNASVEIQASTGGGKEGQVVDYAAFSGYILLRKPQDLRVILFVPIAHVQALNMTSDGKTFTMLIPPRNRAITGSNVPSTESKNPLENLRPFVFTDALMIRGASIGDLISLVTDDRIYQPDPTRKYVIDEPEYDFAVFHHVPGSAELKTQRVIHIGRATLMPYQQDIYDDKGQLATQATYDDYKKFGDIEFPSKITIVRPLDQLRLTVTISKLTVNQKLEDDQFELKVPANVQVQKLP